MLATANGEVAATFTVPAGYDSSYYRQPVSPVSMVLVYRTTRPVDPKTVHFTGGCGTELPPI